MIQYKNVRKIYPGNIVALDGVDFTIDEGEFTFVVGPSGAGKSTIIRLLVKQETPSEGEIYFEDVLVPTIPQKLLSIYRQQLGVVFQDLKLIPSKTVKENIEFALEITGKHINEVEETTQYLLNVVHLENRANLFPEELSGGEKQKIAIARALANDPKLFIADEPTGNLDNDTAREILEILKTINNWGTTVLVITHDQTLVNNLKTRVITLKDGKIVKDEGKEKNLQNTDLPLFNSLSKTIRKKLIQNKISDIDNVLKLTEEDLTKIGLSDDEITKLSDALQNYLNDKNYGNIQKTI